MGVERQCQNNCGHNWCCSISVAFLPQVVYNEEPSIGRDILILHAYRGGRVYRVVHPKYHGYIIVYQTPCRYLGNHRCTTQSSKPQFCREYPRIETGEFLVLPRACPFAASADVVLEDLFHITERMIRDADL